MGIRVALGAGRGDVQRLVLRDSLKLVVAGALIGLPLAMAAARLLGSQLYEVKPHDPFVVAIGLITLLLAALVASYLPDCVPPASTPSSRYAPNRSLRRRSGRVRLAAGVEPSPGCRNRQPGGGIAARPRRT
jgi:predicted lysophospholipase L1 biosynthesis ABC-type transport system permease subunit